MTSSVSAVIVAALQVWSLIRIFSTTSPLGRRGNTVRKREWTYNALTSLRNCVIDPIVACNELTTCTYRGTL